MDLTPKAVIFDLDGCLVDSELLCLAGITEEIQAAGMTDVTLDVIRSRFLGVSIRVICDFVAEGTGRPCPPDFIERSERRIFEAYRKNLLRIDGVQGMLEVLQDRNIKFAIATGGSIARMKETLAISDLAQYFENRAFSADQVAQGKPAPDLFLLAAERLGVDPKDCVVMEDSPHGVVGAVAAGMRAVGFVGGSHLADRRDSHGSLLLSKGAEAVTTTIAEATEALLTPKTATTG